MFYALFPMPIRRVYFMNAWYVIQTKPKKELEARSYLSMKGLEIFFPRMETFAPKGGRITRGIKALFPNYIFGNFDRVRDYSLVKYGKGVNKIVSFSGEPVPISVMVIEEIKGRMDAAGLINLKFNLKPHDRVRIKTGPFRDFLGIFEKWLPEKERVRILLNLIGYQPQIELHFSFVERVA
jgi:transcription antitermination factor NusG